MDLVVIPSLQDDPGCSGWDVGCKVGAKIGDAGENFMGWVVETAVNGLTGFLDVLGTAWFSWPAPNIFDEQSGLAPAVSLLQGSLAPFVVAIAALSFLFALGKMVWTMRAAEARSIMRLLIILAAVTGAAAVTVQTLLAAGDAFAPWIIERASGEDFNATTFQKQFFGAALNPETLSSFLFVVLILAILMTLATLAQVAFMIVRAPLIITMLIFLPLAAASTATEEGMQRFRRTVAFLLAAVLYKPVAAIIYATGIALIRTSDESNSTDQILNMVYGFIIITFAALALPALIKFFMPIAAIGSSNAFSGGAAAAATGAVVMGGAMLAGGAAGGGAGAGAGAGASVGKAGGAVMPPPSGGSQAVAALGPGSGPSSGSMPPGPSSGGGGSSSGPASSGGGGGTGAGRLLPSSGPESRSVGGGDSSKSGAGSERSAMGAATDSGDSASVTGGAGDGTVVGGGANSGSSGSGVLSGASVTGGAGDGAVVGGGGNSGSSGSEVPSGAGAGSSTGSVSSSADSVSGSSSTSVGRNRAGVGSPGGSPTSTTPALASLNASGAGSAGVDQSPFPIAGARARATAQRANAVPPTVPPGVRRSAGRGARHVPEGVGRAAAMAGAGAGINDEQPEGAAQVGERI